MAVSSSIGVDFQHRRKVGRSIDDVNSNVAQRQNGSFYSLRCGLLFLAGEAIFQCSPAIATAPTAVAFHLT
jgi:hypothetical protein